MDTELKVVLTAKQNVSPQIATFTFTSPQDAVLPQWAPGAHISVVLPDGSSRAYSLCGAADAPDSWTVAVLREPDGRGGSLMMHDQLTEGDVVQVGPPRNNFELHPADRYLFIAGGIGITPLLPMIEEVGRRGAEWKLLYLVRERSAAVFLDRLNSVEGGTVEVWCSDDQGFYPLDRLHDLVTDTTKIYSCGPAPLLTALEGMWSDDQLHFERFSNGDTVDSDDDETFEVVLAQSGKTVRVEPGVSVLEAVEAADPSISVLQSCLEGVCGSCETTVLDGVPDHRDLVLTKRQKERCDRMMLCVSRAASKRIVLDL